ncbi:glycosyltransferase family 4 protein [Mesorhizobium sp. B2-5-4]|uniref:glycosyltransferase family 4 protein n=1 Tax=Mesorhizobium sp. B2-5-4 TaxID=2589926 RepID=UPI0011299255|nr:glycosyltransferase family 1 protein [Mesorhizobium sp. B2-5-4]TPK35952.1 glycosyltransferase family 4 protein [Mesorhizobium sp. B2-5-4]
MKIGVDARNLTASFSGIGRYLVEMTRSLSLAGHQLILYMASPPAQPLPSDFIATLRIGAPARASAIQRHIWGQTTLPRQIAEDRLDVFWGPAHRLPLSLPKALARVVTIHDLVWYYYGQTMRRSGWLADRVLMPRAIAIADLVVADSTSTADALHDVLAVSRNKMRIVYPGTTPDVAPNPPTAPLPEGLDRPFVLFVGTLEPRKNLERLLMAYAALAPDLRRASPLAIVGAPGWRQRNVADLAAGFGLTESVKVLGFVSEAVLDSLYRHCRFVAFPSLYEGFGFPIIEANRVGKPVLTSTNSSMIEVAGDAGVLVDAFDIKSIADGLFRLLTDEPLYEALSARARPNAARFDWTNSAQELVDCFQQAMERRRGQA